MKPNSKTHQAAMSAVFSDEWSLQRMSDRDANPDTQLKSIQTILRQRRGDEFIIEVYFDYFHPDDSRLENIKVAVSVLKNTNDAQILTREVVG